GAPELIEIPGFMREAALPDDLELAVVPVRTLEDAEEDPALERREVLAGEVADEIGRGEDGRAVDELHRSAHDGRRPRQLARRKRHGALDGAGAGVASGTRWLGGA